MIAWEKVALSEVATSVDYGVTASATERPLGPKFLRISDIQDGCVDWDRVPWCECDSGAAAAGRLKQGDIVFARTGATTGKSFLIRDCPSDAVFASYLIRVRLGERANSQYVSHYFHTPGYWAQITASARGVAQPGVNASTLKALRIPLPPLTEQRRIAEVLDRAEALRAKRRAALAQLDTLTQSVFLDLFGDQDDGETESLQDLCELITDGTHYTPEYSDSGTLFLSARNVTSGYVDWEHVKFIPESLHRELRKRVSPRLNDILLAKNGTTGVAAIVDRDCIFDIYVSLALLRPKAEVLPIYLHGALNSPMCSKQFRAALKGIGVPNLHLNEIRHARIPHPSLALQREYASRIAAVEKLKAAHRNSLVGLDGLFAVLQHRAFRGEL